VQHVIVLQCVFVGCRWSQLEDTTNALTSLVMMNMPCMSVIILQMACLFVVARRMRKFMREMLGVCSKLTMRVFMI